MSSWVFEELQTVNLGDNRLNKRCHLLLDRLSSKPELSIPGACNGWHETIAAYRFFENKSVTMPLILQSHKEATLKRMGEEAVVLLVQDTTELDYSRQKELEGSGPLNYTHRLGFLLHPTLALTPDRVPLGVLGAKLWSRAELGLGNKRQQRPLEEKESYRWIEGCKLAREVASFAKESKIVSIADREGDIYEYFLEAQSSNGNLEWIVRSRVDRSVIKEKEDGPSLLRASVASAPTMGNIEFTLPASHKRKEKKVVLGVQSKRVRLRPTFRKGKKLPEIDVNVIFLKEINPPDGCEGIDWLLLTSLAVDTLEDISVVINYYLCRWEIEIYNRVLKSGCKIEKLQLESAKRLEACLAIYMIIAWRILYVLMLGRQYSQSPCNLVFEASEWKSVFRIVKKKPIPQKTPQLGDVVIMIAQLGGYLNRRKDGPPGPKAMWIGMQRMKDFAIAWESFGPLNQ